MMRRRRDRRKDKEPFIRGRDFIATMAALASAGFGVVAALAWNSAVQALVREIFPAGKGAGGRIASQFVYALIVTAFAVLVVSWLGRAVERMGGVARLGRETELP